MLAMKEGWGRMGGGVVTLHEDATKKKNLFKDFNQRLGIKIKALLRNFYLKV